MNPDVCSYCRIVKHCHTLDTPDGPVALCGMHVILLVADVERVGNSLRMAVETLATVAA